MFGEQGRPHFSLNSRPAATKLTRKDTHHRVSKKLCVLRYTIKYRKQIRTAIKKFKTYPLKNNNLKKTETCLHICLEEKNNEIVDLDPTFFPKVITCHK